MINQRRNVYVFRVWFRFSEITDWQERYVLADDEFEAKEKLSQYSEWLKENGFCQIESSVCLGTEFNQPVIE